MNIIITGASRGIGFEIVKTLARHKMNHIVAISRNAAALKELQSECTKQYPESKVVPYEFDLSQFDFYPLIVQRFETFIHRCDILIHNAGKLINKPFDKFEISDFDETFNINLKAPFFLTKALLPLLNKGAHVVNIGSYGGIPETTKFQGLAAYSCSKGGLHILTEALARELAGHEIRVNCLALGSVQTEMFTRAFPGQRAMISPAQIAQFIADFAVSGSKYINGKVIPVAMAEV